jgi:hypothetical protein
MFLLDEAVKLLVGKRTEHFKYERAIQLFQFQVWSLTPEYTSLHVTDPVNRAGQMAAIMLLDYLEEEAFYDSPEAYRRFGPKEKPKQTMEQIVRMREANPIYRDIYDFMITLPRGILTGGLLGLLGAPSPRYFDLVMANQQADAEAAVSIVDYRLRYIQHGPDDRRGSRPRHAFYFIWAATKDIPGRRGKTAKGKAPSTRTLATKWHRFKKSAIFLYLNERHGFSQSLIRIDDFEFVSKLLKHSENVEELRRYFGAYAYIAESFEAAGGEQPFVEVPDSVARVPVSTAIFSNGELDIIAAYDEDKHLIDSKLEPDDLDVDI